MSKIIDLRSVFTYPQANSVICYQQLAGTWTATSSLTAFPVTNLANDTTDDAWLALDTQTATVDFGANKTISYVALQTVVGDFVDAVQYSTNGTDWTTIHNTPTAAQNTMLYLFNSVTARYVRVTVSAATALDYAGLSVVFIGLALVTDRPAVYGGATRIVHARADEIADEMSEEGQWLGSTVQRKGYDFKVEWNHLGAVGGATWYQNNFDVFAEDRIGKPFFIAPRPSPASDTKDDVLYCVSKSNIVPTNGIRNFKDVSLSLRGFGVE